MSNEFQDLNNIDYLKENPAERSLLWSKLLEYLNEEPANMITNEDGGEEGSLFNTIQENIDLPDSTHYVNGFYDDIYNDLVSSINSNPNILLGMSYDDIPISDIENSYWNTSIVETMFNYGINYDFNLRVSYYSGFLFEDENGIIQQFSRYKKIGSSDAGSSFEKETGIYEGGYSLTFSYFYNDDNQKIPFEPFTFIIKSKDTLEKNHEHYFDLFHLKNGGPRWPDWLKMLNREIEKGWRWIDIISAVENDEIYKLGFVGEWASWEEFKNYINSIIPSSDTPLYGKGKLIKEKYGRVLKPWVSPWSNYYGETYAYVRKDDKKLSVLDNEKQLDLTRLNENEAKDDVNFNQQADRKYQILEQYVEEKQKLIDIPGGIATFVYFNEVEEPFGSIDMNNRQYPADNPFDTVDISYFYWPLSDFQTGDTHDFYITIACSKLKQSNGQYPIRINEQYCEQYCKDIVQTAIDQLGGDVVYIPGSVITNTILEQPDPDGIITGANKVYDVYINTKNDICWIYKNYLYLVGQCGSIRTIQREIEDIAKSCNIFYSDLVIIDTKEETKIIDKNNFKNLYSKYGYNWARLLMPQNKRRVEIEDLNRNFWVIGQTIAAISRDVIDKDGIYPTLLGQVLNEVMQLWENVIFLWSQIAIQSQKWPAVHSEVVYITFDDLRDYFNYDLNFNESEIEALKVNQTNSFNIIISRLIRSQDLEETVVKFLRQYRLKYADYNVSLYPILRLNNYSRDFYSRCIILGEYKYCHNYDKFELDVVDPQDESIVNPPRGVIYEIDGKEVFFTTFSNWDTEYQCETTLTKRDGQMDYHHCQFKESFFSYSRYEDFTGENNNYYIFDIDAENFSNWIYGIAEKDDEENYIGCCPVSKSEDVETENGEIVYSLILFSPSLQTIFKNSIKEGIWITQLHFLCYDVAKMLLYGEPRESLTNQIYHGTYIGGNIEIGDSRNRQHDDLPLIQLEPANNEFGFFKGELLTYPYSTKKAKFNFIDLKKIFLRPTYYQNEKEYSYYYGAEDAPDIIKQDVENDEYALTNYLVNVYDNWAQHSDDKTSFWASRANKIKLPNGQWTEDYSEIIAYNRNNNSVNEVKKKRSEVNQAIDNNTIVWQDFNEDWRRDAINKLNIDSNKVNPLTILFVSGERYYDFNPRKGEGQTGYDMMATDGLLHHGWPADSQTVQSGAAIRIPSTTMGPIYSTYPRHSEATKANGSLWDHYHKYVYLYINRTANVVAQGDNLPKSYQPNRLLDKQVDFRKLPLRDQNKNWLVSEDRGYDYSSGNIYTVLRKTGDQNFTEDNWLVNNIYYRATGHIQYLIPSNANDFGSLLSFPYNQRGTDNPTSYSTTIRGKVSSALGGEVSIESLNDNEYYQQLYQRYIYYNWGLKAKEENKTIDEYLSINNITIEQVLYDNNSNNSYYLNLKNVLFGWIRIEDGNNIYTAKFHINNPFIYEDGNELIEDMRKNYDGSINKIYNSENGREKIKNFITLINNFYPNEAGEDCWDNRIEPSFIDTISSNNLACYGNIGKYFGTNISGKDDLETQWNIWLEDRIMLAQFETQRFLGQELLFNATDENNNKIWPNSTLAAAMGIHSGAWFDVDEQTQIQKIENLIRPLEGTLSNTFTLTTQLDNITYSYDIKDKFYLNSYRVSYIQNYVFGPNRKYARRSVYRYPDYSDTNDDWIKDIVNTEEGTSGHWSKRPINPTLSTDENKLWYDDYDITGTTIDEVRAGYTIYQTIGEESSWQIEKYKTNKNKEMDDIAKALASAPTNLDFKYAESDDPDFNNIPEGEIYPLLEQEGE